VIVSLAYAALGFQIKHVEPEVAIEAPPEEAALYGIGGQRVEPTAHETVVTGAQ
jgi:hypothetical protein